VARELAPGAPFAGLRVERLIAAGGMGRVYLARDETLKRPVALKVVADELADDPHYRDRFLLEAELAARLEHPAIVPVYAAGESDGELYLAMRFVDGGTLADRLDAEGRFDPEELVRLLGPVAEALDAAHRVDLIHRDVKPGNVLLDGSRAYLADFGLARQTAAPESLVSAAAAAQLSGTMGYLAPEQIEGDGATGASDQYALACLLFECLAGEKPFERSDPLAVVYAHLSEPPPALARRRPDLPKAADAVLARGLAKRPEDRYPTCQDLVVALADACGVERAMSSSRPRRRTLAAVASVAVIAAAAAGAAILLRSSGSPSKTTGAAVVNPLMAIDTATSRIVGRYNAGPAPIDVTAGAGSLWVLNNGSHTVYRVDPKTGRQVDVVGVGGGTPAAITFGEGGVWVSGTRSTQVGVYADTVVEIDPATDTPSDPIQLPLPKPTDSIVGGSSILAAAGAVWVVDAVGDLVRIDPATHTLHVTAGPGLAGVQGDAQSVWALGPDTIIRVDPHTGAIVKSFPNPFGADGGGPAVGAGSVWVSSADEGVLARIDPSSGAIRRRIPIPRDVDWVYFGDGRVWGVDSLDGTMVTVDPATERAASIPIIDSPLSFVATGGKVWVVAHGPTCTSVVHAPGVTTPQFIVASEFPLVGDLRKFGKPLSDATLSVLRARKFMAGRYSLGYQQCDYGAPNGDFSTAYCAANARAHALETRLIGVVGTYNSRCSEVEIPILAAARGGPIPMVSPANTNPGLTMMGRTNFARVLGTDAQYEAAVMWVVHNLGRHRVFLIGHPDETRWVGDTTDLPRARLGIQIVGAAPWATSEADAGALARQVRASHADAVVLAPPLDAGAFSLRALRRMFADRLPLVAADTLGAPLLRKSAKSLADGVYVVTDAPPYSQLTPAGQAWARGFSATEPGGAVSQYAPYAAQATTMLLEAIAKSDGTRASVIRQLHAPNASGTLIPDFALDRGGDVTPARFWALRIGPEGSAAGSIQPDLAGATVALTVSVPDFVAGLAPATGTPVSIATSQQADHEPGCPHTIEQPCHDTGTFRARDGATAAMICPGGTTRETEWGTWPTVARRVLACADGSTLTLQVKRYISGTVTPNQQLNLGESWVILGGTGRLAGLQGNGPLIELWTDSREPYTWKGTLTGLVRRG
jgi:ABC-type branched-subunit amino acid transport system substrate-binding protein/streptogramin lyase